MADPDMKAIADHQDNPFKIAQGPARSGQQVPGAARRHSRCPAESRSASCTSRCRSSMDDGTHEGLQGFPCPVQRRTWPDEGWYSLPPGRDHRHRPRPRGLDDLEDRRRGHPARRRQGRHHLRPEVAVRRVSSSVSRASTSSRSAASSASTRTFRLPTSTPTPQIMAWMTDEYYWQKGYNEPGAFTGKPIWRSVVRSVAATRRRVVVSTPHARL